MADPTAGLVFDERLHRYFLDGKRVVGVTEALKIVTESQYAAVPPELLAAKAAFGTAVHKVIELDCLGTLDIDNLDPVYVPYHAAWRDFLARSGFEVLRSECKVLSRRYGYAGQLDLLGKLNGILSMVDAKCVTTVMPSTGPQTAAYEQATRETYPDLIPPTAPVRRYALQLTPGSSEQAKWRLVPLTGARDLNVFLACVTNFNWIKENLK